jgi:hypothetical protein
MIKREKTKRLKDLKRDGENNLTGDKTKRLKDLESAFVDDLSDFAADVASGAVDVFYLYGPG